MIELINTGGNTLGIDGANVPVYTMSPVPEPSTLPLLGAGALALAAIAARRKKKSVGNTKA